MRKILRSILVLALFAVVEQASAQSAVFTETFANCAGTGGNDNTWSGISGNTALTDDNFDTYADNAGWTASTAYVGSGCIYVGKSKAAGSVTTPSISLTGNGTLTFKAGAWSSDAKTLNITATGATLDATQSAITDLSQGSFTEYTVTITDATGDVKITFAGASSKNRFMLDDVVVTSSTGTSKTAAGLAFSETSATAFVGETFTAPTLTNPNNLAVTYSSSNEDVATVDANGNVTIVAAGSTSIVASSEETDTYAAGKASYTLTVGTVVSTIAEFKAVGTDNLAKWNVKDVQVLYVSGNDMYVRDETGAIDFYKSGLSYTAGQILNGTLVATYDEYNSLPEATNIQDAELTAADGTAEPTVVDDVTTLGEANYCDLVKVSGAYDATNSTLGGVAVYDKFKTGALENLTDGGTYTMVAICISYKSAPELCPVSEDLVTGINALETNEEAEGAIYNLAGQRVNENYKGVVIRNGKKYINK
jgi:hypothetical protein